MINYITNQYKPDFVSPPGDTLRELLEDKNLSQSDLATRMGRPKKTISEIVNGKTAITNETALQLELVLGVPAEFWNTRELHYREYLARASQDENLEQYYDWACQFPLSKMASQGMIPKVREPTEKVRYLLQFLGVSAPDQWTEVYEKCSLSFRRSAVFEADDFALGAWLRAGVIQSNQLRVSSFEESRFLDCLTSVRSLTKEPPSVFQPAVESLCADSGVAVTFVPQLPKCRVSGVSRWLNHSTASIQLSLRHRTDDHFWFTFFHEAAHLLLHEKRSIFLDTDKKEGDQELEANSWAAEFLIPGDKFDELRSWRVFSKAAIVQFAKELDIAPGIVVGRLQHEGLIPHRNCNDLKKRFEWVDSASS